MPGYLFQLFGKFPVDRGRTFEGADFGQLKWNMRYAGTSAATDEQDRHPFADATASKS